MFNLNFKKMKIQILKSANASMEGKTIEFDSITENSNDGMPFADCGNGMVLTDLSYCLVEAEKRSVVACLGGQTVHNGQPVIGILVYGKDPKNLVVINQFKFI